MADGFVDNWELTGIEQVYYTMQHKGNEGGAVMEKMVKRPSGDDGLLQGGVHKPNLEKLVSFAEDLDEDGSLIPAFLALLEVCFQS